MATTAIAPTPIDLEHDVRPTADDEEPDEADDDDEVAMEREADVLESRYQDLVSFGPLGGGGGAGSSLFSGGGGGLAKISQTAGASLRAAERSTSGQDKHSGGITRDTRATREQVLDPRTRLILFKLINSGVLASINGCVSTGKEANVYHAFGADGAEFAVKVYKTSILIFKDRDRYVSGEFRFRHGYCKSNPRKMVRMWAEKEMRNYRRLALAGLATPPVHLLREHVLLMGFIGRDGLAAPRLKDATLSLSQYTEAATQVGLMLRSIYHQCRLVHADFSEYNLLW